LQRIAQVPVTLPKADPLSRPNPDDPTVYLQVSDEGTFYWKVGNNPTTELISASEIAPRLQDYRNRLGQNARVLVRGDTRARFGAAVMVLDEVRKAGIEQVSVETVSSSTGK
jgi:biopolymer transport protein ExbD